MHEHYNPELKMAIITGSEGPRHDPYSYKEIMMTLDNGTIVTYHGGLGEYTKIKYKSGNEETWNKKLAITAFKGETGITPQEAEEKFYQARDEAKKKQQEKYQFNHIPFNIIVHAFLTHYGYKYTAYDSDWEDMGDAENGPSVHGSPPYDEYVSNNEIVYVDWNGVAHREDRDLEQEAAEEAMWKEMQGGNFE